MEPQLKKREGEGEGGGEGGEGDDAADAVVVVDGRTGTRKEKTRQLATNKVLCAALCAPMQH